MVGPPAISANHVITLFWSRLRDDLGEGGLVDYQRDQEEILALARAMPGLVSVTPYTGVDGERLTVVVFDSEESQTAWRRHPEHLAAQRRGKTRYYAAYQIIIANPSRFYAGGPAA